ncbi:hypothetical protein U9M48_015203 [Paspalum notatum var. saurae]|uniref:Uncharacterized protein n=1 Tax=Paspalum notatum var. saurae TaxID=547442 RepID=A0AAQ3WLQ3_PASNO
MVLEKWPSDFGGMLERIANLNQPWLITLEPAKAYSEGDSLFVVPRRHSDARIAADGENRGGVAVGRHGCIRSFSSPLVDMSLRRWIATLSLMPIPLVFSATIRSGCPKWAPLSGSRPRRPNWAGPRRVGRAP